MEHVVFYPGPDAAPAFRRFASLEEAVGFVEHLRNTEGVAEVSVHALSPVPLAFRAYYKVEVPAEPVAEAAAVAVPVQPVPASLAEEPVAEAEPLEAAAAEAAVDVMPAGNGKRSLGFFAH
jgi:hypothetical protein